MPFFYAQNFLLMFYVRQGLVKVVFGTKGNNYHKWHRISRQKIEKYASFISSQNNFYYAKIYEYVRTGKGTNGTKSGYVTKQIGYIHWDNDGVLQIKKT